MIYRLGLRASQLCFYNSSHIKHYSSAYKNPCQALNLYTTKHSTRVHNYQKNYSRNMSTAAPPQTSDPQSDPKPKHKYIDVGINLSDPIFKGKYHGKQAHDPDLDDVITRSLEAGCVKLMVTGSNLKDSRAAIQLAEQYPGVCYATVGVHPCSTQAFTSHPAGPAALLASLRDLALTSSRAGNTVAFGEIGLDYDRLFLSPKDTQLAYFEAQLDLAVELGLPLFLHSRAAAEDFERLLAPRLPRLPKGGLVHSYTGTLEELDRLLALGLDIGVNGCSLKTEDNLAVVKHIPLERLHLETDGPWCEIRPSHASAKFLKEEDAPVLPRAVKKEKWTKGAMVKGRNEPCTIAAVAHVVARVKGVGVEEVVEHAWRNSVKMFGMGET